MSTTTITTTRESDKTTIIINNDDNVCQQQQQVAMKITFVPTEENRLVHLPCLSLAHLTDKIRAIFATDDFTLHYIDDEGDRVTVSLDDELACAVACVDGAKPLRLFVTPTAAITIVSPTAPKATTPKVDEAIDAEAITIKSEPCPSEQEQEGAVDPAAAPETKEEREEIQFEALLAKLEEKAFGGGSSKADRRRNLKLLTKFAGDLDKVELVLNRRQCRTIKKKERHQTSKDRKQDPASAAGTDTEPSIDVEALLAQLEEKGFGGNDGKRRRDERLLKRFSGDIDQVVAFLEARRLKCQQARKNPPATPTTPDLTESQVECLLAELDEKGFGGNEVKRRRNASLLRRFSGDVVRVEAVLTARRNKMITDIATEYEPLLAQLEEKGFGGGDFERKRNVRLIKRFAGDMTRVEALLASRKESAVKADNAQLEPLLGQLEGLGGGGEEERTRRRNVRLLRKFKGDVGQVEAWLLTKRQQCEARQQQRRAERCLRNKALTSSEAESAC